jgi:hypothetical protein
MIDSFSLLSADETSNVVAGVDALRPHWIRRDPGGRFSTLGRAAYLDLCGGRGTIESYLERATQQNEILRLHCESLLEIVRARIEQELGRKTVLTDKWALPGFHIFQGPGIRSAGSGGAHFDLQFRELIGEYKLERVRPLSFTLALELPPAGSGLRVWPLLPSHIATASGRARADNLTEYMSRKPSIYVRYQVGVLYLQRKPFLHCICKDDPVLPADRRITLQGHGIEHEDQVVLYW